MARHIQKSDLLDTGIPADGHVLNVGRVDVLLSTPKMQPKEARISNSAQQRTPEG